MIRLGLRLTRRGGREAAARLVVIVVAVAIGVGMLLAAVAGINAVNAQNSRYAWLETGSAPGPAAPATSGSAADPLLWRIAEDRFDDKTIVRVDVAATGPDSPAPPGIPRLPGPGEFYASPALTALLRATLPAELGARYGGRQVGTIGSVALPPPTRRSSSSATGSTRWNVSVARRRSPILRPPRQTTVITAPSASASTPTASTWFSASWHSLCSSRC